MHVNLHVLYLIGTVVFSVVFPLRQCHNSQFVSKEIEKSNHWRHLWAQHNHPQRRLWTVSSCVIALTLPPLLQLPSGHTICWVLISEATGSFDDTMQQKYNRMPLHLPYFVEWHTWREHRGSDLPMRISITLSGTTCEPFQWQEQSVPPTLTQKNAAWPSNVWWNCTISREGKLTLVSSCVMKCPQL